MSNTEYVYILFNGVDHEGGSVISVHKTKEGANKSAQEYAQKYGYSSYKGYWSNGCAYVEVQEMELN